MINHLDNLLRHLFMAQINDITTEAQVRFQPPDEDWRNEVINLQEMALNVYLADLRENRKLRSNARVRVGEENGQVMQVPAPARLDCHYLISAWSPAQPGQAVEPTPDEHALLYQVTGVLMNNAPLNATRIYGEGSPALPAVPESIREADLPTQILPVEGFLKLAEFWGTMGVNHRWKPAVYLIVTLPVVLQAEVAGPLVTTRVTEFRQADQPEMTEVRVQIGGQVRTLAGDAIPDALVDLLDVGLRARTNAQGRYTFPLVPAGTRTLRVVAVGFQPITQPLEVPEPFGNYDIILTAL